MEEKKRKRTVKKRKDMRTVRKINKEGKEVINAQNGKKKTKSKKGKKIFKVCLFVFIALCIVGGAIVFGIIAGIAANGITEVFNIHHIDRGYENIEEKFRKLGAHIERVSYSEDESLE